MTLGERIPEKYFYTIGEICRLTGTKAHILRYWESQFKLLRPARRYSGHRKYTQRDLELINRIRYLIIDRRFTLAGAKKEINRQFAGKPSLAPGTSTTPGTSAIPFLRELKKEIDECLDIFKPQDAIQQEFAGLK
jgi:DNA-binding transcriptional MerR regulator